jgi:electron transport complex protein RnfC
MSYFGFSGGVHPEYKKDNTKSKPIEPLIIKKSDEVFVPLSQHIGAPCKPEVKKKDFVKRGQMIGSPTGFISSAVHSPVTGEVLGIVRAPYPALGKVDSVHIKVTEETEDYDKIESNKSFQDIVLSAGIVGLGGATFPTHVKLSPPKKIDYLIVNGAECEPYLTCDHRLMLEHTEEILGGILLVREHLGKDVKVIIGIEENKMDAIEKFRQLVDVNYDVEIVPLEVKYPQGGEKQLIKATTNRVVPEGKLPLEVGVVVQNVATCYAIFEAVTYKKPLMERVVTVTGAVLNPKNLLVKIGTPVSKVIEECGGFLGKPKKIISGGPMMGLAISSTDTPVTKGTSGIIIYREEDVKDLKMTNCIRCGRCVAACPMGLLPVVMEQFVINEMYERVIDFHVLNCIECGCCSYVCPARRHLVGYFKTAKRKVAKILKQRQTDAER